MGWWWAGGAGRQELACRHGYSSDRNGASVVINALRLAQAARLQHIAIADNAWICLRTFECCLVIWRDAAGQHESCRLADGAINAPFIDDDLQLRRDVTASGSSWNCESAASQGREYRFAVFASGAACRENSNSRADDAHHTATAGDHRVHSSRRILGKNSYESQSVTNRWR